MNQQKTKLIDIKAAHFLKIQSIFIISLVIFFSLFFTPMIERTIADPLAIQGPESTTKTTEPTTQTTESTTKTTEPTTQTTESTTKTTEPTTQTTEQDTKTNDPTLDQTSTTEEKITENTNSTESTESTESSNSTLINNSYDQKDSNIIILMNESTSNEQMDSYITSANINIYLEGDIGNITINNQISVITTEKEKYRSIIKQVDFATQKNYTDVHITISELEDRPDEVTTEPNLYQKNKIYKYLDIKLIAANSTYIGERGISAMTFTFTIEKSWIEDYKLDRNTIVMMRYHNDTWQNLTTTYLNETEEFLYFSAETPGLSIFAVVGNEIIEDSDAIVDKSIQIPIWFTFGVVLSSSTLLGIVLVKKRFIYRT